MLTDLNQFQQNKYVFIKIDLYFDDTDCVLIQGEELMEEIEAKGFVECSAKTRENLAKLFETALKIAIENKK